MSTLLSHSLELPDNHPIEWLAEAKQFYGTRRPPFVQLKKNKFGGRKTVILTADSPSQKDSPINIDVVYRTRNKRDSYCTLDVDGKRFIVKAFSGGAGGYDGHGFRTFGCGVIYRCWLGSIEDFSPCVVAFSSGGEGFRPAVSREKGRLGRKPKVVMQQTRKDFEVSDFSDDEYTPCRALRAKTTSPAPRRR